MNHQHVVTANLHPSGLLTHAAERSINERPPRVPGAAVVKLAALPEGAGPHTFDAATGRAVPAGRAVKLAAAGLDPLQADRDLLLADLAAAGGLAVPAALAAHVERLRAL